MTGAEYLTVGVLESLWNEIGAAFRDERARSRLGTQELRRSPSWPPTRPASPPTAGSSTSRSALREYAGEAKKDRLLSLLLRPRSRPGACRLTRRRTAVVVPRTLQGGATSSSFGK